MARWPRPLSGAGNDSEEEEGRSPLVSEQRAVTLPEKRRITDRKSAKRVADRAQSGAVTRQFPGGLSRETEAEVGLKQVRLPALSVRSQVALLSTGAASS